MSAVQMMRRPGSAVTDLSARRTRSVRRLVMLPSDDTIIITYLRERRHPEVNRKLVEKGVALGGVAGGQDRRGGIEAET